MEASKKLTVRDLIHIGVYSTLYLVVFFMCSLLSIVPVLYPFIPVAAGILCGIPFMMFMTKVNKPGMIFIMLIIMGMVAFLLGYTWIPIVTAIVFGFLAELILKVGGYKKFSTVSLAYATASVWAVGIIMPMWVLASTYVEFVRENMGDQYTDSLLHYMPWWMGFVFVGLYFVFGLVGAFVGRKMLKKHFERAGIV